MRSSSLSDDLFLLDANWAKSVLTEAEKAPEQATAGLRNVASGLVFASTSIHTDELGRVIGRLINYPGIFALAKGDISNALGRALDRINYPAPFQGFGRNMTPANYCAYLGHLNEGDPRYHFAAKEFVEQLQVLAKKPELLTQVVTPAMIEQAVFYTTVNSNCGVYRYADQLFNIVDQHPQYLEAAQKGVIQAMHNQIEQQPTTQLQQVGQENCVRLAEDLMRHANFAGFLASTIATDEVIGNTLRSLLPPVPGAPVAKDNLGRLPAKGEAPTA